MNTNNEPIPEILGKTIALAEYISDYRGGGDPAVVLVFTDGTKFIVYEASQSGSIRCIVP